MSEKVYRFTASWCQPCKMQAKNLEDAKLDATIEVVDIDAYPDMVETYGIRSVPTLVRASDYKKLIGVKTPAEIKDWFNS